MEIQRKFGFQSPLYKALWSYKATYWTKKNSRETDSRSGGTQHFVWNLKVHHLVHNLALSQLNPTHNLSPPEIHYNVILTSTPMYPRRCPSLRVSE